MTSTLGPRQRRRTAREQMWRHTALFMTLMVMLAVVLVAVSGGR